MRPHAHARPGDQTGAVQTGYGKFPSKSCRDASRHGRFWCWRARRCIRWGIRVGDFRCDPRNSWGQCGQTSDFDIASPTVQARGAGIQCEFRAVGGSIQLQSDHIHGPDVTQVCAAQLAAQRAGEVRINVQIGIESQPIQNLSSSLHGRIESGTGKFQAAQVQHPSLEFRLAALVICGCGQWRTELEICLELDVWRGESARLEFACQCIQFQFGFKGKTRHQQITRDCATSARCELLELRVQTQPAIQADVAQARTRHEFDLPEQQRRRLQ